MLYKKKYYETNTLWYVIFFLYICIVNIVGENV